MHSKKEIEDALDQMKAFKFLHASSEATNLEAECTYGILSEELEREQWFVIQGVLSEWSGGADYAGKGVDLSQMVKEVLSRNDNDNVHAGERLEESVVRYCLEKCCVEVVDGRAILSVDYVSSLITLLSHSTSLYAKYKSNACFPSFVVDCQKSSTLHLQFADNALGTNGFCRALA